MKSALATIALSTLLLAPAFAFAQVQQTTQTLYQYGAVSTGSGYVPANGGGLSTGIVAPSSVTTSTCTAGVGCVASMIIFIINNILVPLLFAVSFIVFLYGVAKTYIFSHGETGEVAEGHQVILWGLIGFVVMISLWGLVNVVSNTFGLGGVNGPPTLPRSQ
jgi:hypothetical protein